MVFTHALILLGCVNDTPAFNRHFDELQKHTDLILLDIKHIDNDKQSN